jgi:hypothetical protein
VIDRSSVAAGHGPAGSFDVKRNTYVPATVAVKVILAGEAVWRVVLKLPSPPAGCDTMLQAPVVDAPESTAPDKVIFCAPHSG